MTYDEVQSVAHHLLHRTKIRPEVGIICGSGLGELAEDLDEDNDTDVFPYKDIPNFPTTTGLCSIMHINIIVIHVAAVLVASDDHFLMRLGFNIPIKLLY